MLITALDNRRASSGASEGHGPGRRQGEGAPGFTSENRWKWNDLIYVVGRDALQVTPGERQRLNVSGSRRLKTLYPTCKETIYSDF